jgi:hypothetical protein
MQTLTKDQIDAVLGKTSFWNPDPKKQLIGLTPYLGGILDYDAGLADLSFAASPVNLYARPNGLLIQKMRGLGYVSVGLLKAEVLLWTIEVREQIFAQKEKSVVGRALIGGLLLGPVGLLVGGLSGIGTKTVNVSEGPENVLSITHPGGLLLFSVSNKDRARVAQFFSQYYPAGG